MNAEIAIKVENLSKVYPLHQAQVGERGEVISVHQALQNVSFEIKKGERIGIIGSNGSGKSTLLKLLSGITKPSSGSISIRGKVASILDIGAGFHPELSGRENIFLNGQIHGFSKKEIETKFHEIVAFSGINQFIDEPVKNYSNGMYLRLAFSIMAHLDFDVYLLDEVLNVGDAEFMYASGNWIKNNQKTFVIVSHNIKELMLITSKIAKVQGGAFRFIESSELLDLKINAQVLSIDDHYSNRTQGHKDFEILLLNHLNQQQQVFQYADEIVIEVRLNETVKAQSIGIIIRTFNNIFVCESSFDLDQSGTTCYRATIPSHFFNNMQYKIDSAFIVGQKIVHYDEEVATFVVVNAPTPLGVNTWGVVMPRLTWFQG